ncbi:MAG: FHA domain-containing protein [Pseudomonadota bacterium]
MMKLILTNEEGEAKEFPLDKPITEIGRRSGNDIQLTGREISGLHALIESDGARFTLVDRDSTNGTWIDGERISKPTELTPNSAFKIGKFSLSLREARTQPVALPALSGGEDELEDQPPMHDSAGDNSVGSVATSGRAQITINSGIKAGSTIDIVKAVTTVGRPGVQVVAINRQADGYYALHVETLQCNDKATVNERVLDDMPVKLSHGDALRVAGTEIRFEFKAAS